MCTCVWGQRSTSIVIRCCLHVPPYYFLHVYVCVVCSRVYMFLCVCVCGCVHAEARMLMMIGVFSSSP